MKRQTADAIDVEIAAGADEISTEFNIDRDTVITEIRWRYEKFKDFFPNVNWAINVYSSGLKYDAAAEAILARYAGYKISRALALKIAQSEETDAVCARCDGRNCPKFDKYRCHTVKIVDGEVKLTQGICHYERDRRLKKKIEAAKIPARYAGLTFDNYAIDAGNKNAVNWAKSIVKNPQQGVYIYGGAGTGKTFLAAILAQELMKTGKSVLFVDVPSLLDNLKTTFNNKSGNDTTLDEMMEALQAADMLILDDMGTENPTNWAAERIFIIVNDRYNAQKPVIVTSNLELDALLTHFTDEIIGARIVSRLQQMCKLAEINGGDRRLIRRK